MHPNEQLIQDFYQAFNQRNAQKMAESYHQEANFQDAVFQLKGKEIGQMWQMLCESGKDLRIELKSCRADDQKGEAHWEAFYTFSRTGRKVYNIIKAEFVFENGKIHNHTDRFDFWRWSRYAFGLTGILLGWTSFFKQKVASVAQKNLRKFIQKNES